MENEKLDLIIEEICDPSFDLNEFTLKVSEFIALPIESIDSNYNNTVTSAYIR